MPVVVDRARSVKHCAVHTTVTTTCRNLQQADSLATCPYKNAAVYSASHLPGRWMSGSVYQWFFCDKNARSTCAWIATHYAIQHYQWNLACLFGVLIMILFNVYFMWISKIVLLPNKKLMLWMSGSTCAWMTLAAIQPLIKCGHFNAKLFRHLVFGCPT